MKLYKSHRNKDDDVIVDVVENGVVLYELPLRLELYNHSPTGFSHGYGGSGPHQLALALVADATGDDDLALSKYHKFVGDYVSGWGMDDNFEIDQQTILDWVSKQ